jgi:6-phosphofructokinase 1
MELWMHYDVRDIVGFRYGYRGLVASLGHDVVRLDPLRVESINAQGGTILGTSRGSHDASVMVDRIVELGLDMLFVIGGDGAMKGAYKIADEIKT